MVGLVNEPPLSRNVPPLSSVLVEAVSVPPLTFSSPRLLVIDATVLFTVLLIVILRLTLRLRWLAVPVVVLILSVTSFYDITALWTTVFPLTSGVLLTVVALKFGLLSLVVARCVWGMLGAVPLTPDIRLAASNRQVDVLIRPESLQLCGEHGTPAQVTHVSYHGTRKLYTLRLPSGTLLCGLFPSEVTLQPGEQIRVTLQLADVVAFPHTAQVSSG